MKPSISLVSIILTTYNRPDALENVLLALDQQTIIPNEVIVADDGSSHETSALIYTLQPQLNYSLVHVWQPDEGFQAAKIRNKAIAQAQNSYLIFMDGDCIPPTNFVENHLRLAEQQYFVAGNRILLSNAFTQRVIQERLPVYNWNYTKWIWHYLKGDTNRIIPLLKFMPNCLRKLNSKKWQGVKTCNLGVWKEDFIRINGFDESFKGWGYEDSDFVIRLIRSGVSRKSGKCAAPVLHLWHPEYDRSQEKNNRALLAQTENSQKIIAKLGVKQYLS